MGFKKEWVTREEMAQRICKAQCTISIEEGLLKPDEHLEGCGFYRRNVDLDEMV